MMAMFGDGAVMFRGGGLVKERCLGDNEGRFGDGLGAMFGG